MKLKIIDDPFRLKSFLNDPKNTGNIVDIGDEYYIKPDALYLGIYEGALLVGVHEVRPFWHSTLETHPIYDPGFRGQYAIDGHKLFFGWLLNNSTFTNIVTMVPDTTRYGAAAVIALGASRAGRIEDAYLSCGEAIGVTLYQLTRKRCGELYSAYIPVSQKNS